MAASPLEPFHWQRSFGNLCEAPLTPLAKDDMDDGQPVLEFDSCWHSLPKKDGLPCRSAFNPMKMPRILPWMMIFDMMTNEGRRVEFVLRLQGTRAANMTFGDHTGKELSEFVADQCYQDRRFLFLEALEKKRPGFATAAPQSQCEFRTEVAVGVFPFCDDRRECVKQKCVKQICVVAAPADPKVRSWM